MATTSSSGETPAGLPVWRLHLLRALYALIGLGEGSQVIPLLFRHAPLDRGVIPSLLAAMCLLDLLGIKYPVRMFPLLLFELVWKSIWVLSYGLRQWSSGQVPPTFNDDFKPILFGMILMLLVTPWGYVWRQYVKAPGDRWR